MANWVAEAEFLLTRSSVLFWDTAVPDTSEFVVMAILKRKNEVSSIVHLINENVCFNKGFLVSGKNVLTYNNTI